MLTNAEGKNIVHNLTRRVVSSAKEFEQIYNDASSSRSTASTKLNSVSSRSHAVLTVYAKIEEVAGDSVLLGRINLVDLAGSENNKVRRAPHTLRVCLLEADLARISVFPADGQRQDPNGRELCDQQVVDHARERDRRCEPRTPSCAVPVRSARSAISLASRHPLTCSIVYNHIRDSKLTRILQDTLGGSSVGLLICNISPGATFRQDTLNTLNFATRTKEVENRADINVQERPAPKPHFAALTKKPAGQGPVYRDNLGPPSRPTPIGGVPSRPTSAAAAPIRRVFGEVTSNPVVVRVVAAGGGGLKGKGGGKGAIEDEAAEEVRPHASQLVLAVVGHTDRTTLPFADCR